MFTCDGTRDCVHGSDENLDQCWGKFTMTSLYSSVDTRINVYHTCLRVMAPEIVYTAVART